MRKIECVVLFVLLITVHAAGTSMARVVARETFDLPPLSEARGIVEGREGAGWTQKDSQWKVEEPDFVDIMIRPEPARKGAISFDLQRKRGQELGYRSIFSLLDANRETLLLLQIKWQAGFDPRPILHLRGRPYYSMGLEWWSSWILLDERIVPGQWVHFDLVWDDRTERYELFLDGRPQDTEPKRYGPKGEVLPDVRRELMELRKREGRQVRNTSGPFSSLLERAECVRLGIHTEPKAPHSGTSPLTNAVIDNFTVMFDEVPLSAGGAPPEITFLTHDSRAAAGFSGSLVAGDTVTVTMEGTPDSEVTFDVAPLADMRGEIPVSWKGYGVYLEDITFFEEDQVDLSEVEEYRVYASTAPLGEITGETTCVEKLEVEDQSCLLEGLEPGTPHYIAVMALMDDGTLRPVVKPVQGLPMTELEGSPGMYEGTFSVGYRHRYPKAVIVGRMASAGLQIMQLAEEEVVIDPSLTIVVETESDEIRADEESTAEITVRVADANGNPVRDHEIRFLLATTSQYTGVVGGGIFIDEVGGTLGRDTVLETNMSGEVKTTYTAGFAAKTAIIVARDMMSNDTGAGYIKTYISATAELELEAVQEVAAKSLGYSIMVTSSDEWLTADGESEARITALVTKDGMPMEGHRVSFHVSSGAGQIRTVRGETSDDGKARAVYTAGKKVGTVLITATDHTVGITGSVQIELRSDAPAKITLKVEPDLLPADGRSTADIEVVVTDINDNPNEGVGVEYEVVIGRGKLRRVEAITNDAGESSAQYVAGRIPGKVSIEVTVRSEMPTEEEMAVARDLALAVKDYDFY